MSQPSSRLKAVLLALLVTFFWSTSWVLIKFGLRGDSLPALTFAGLRYTVAFACLLPWVLFQPARRTEIRRLDKAQWGSLVVFGIVNYTFTQGTQFLALAYLPTAVVNLVLNLSPIAVALMMLRGSERATLQQWAGILLCIGGVGVFFYPVNFPAGQWLGIFFAFACMFFNALSARMGRQVNVYSGISTSVITLISMGIGSIAMLIAGLITQGVGQVTLTEWLIIAWLALINTAFSFTVWNHTLRTLTAVESAVLAGMMMPQVAVMAWIFLGEVLTGKEIFGMFLVGVGALVVQVRLRWRRNAVQSTQPDDIGREA